MRIKPVTSRPSRLGERADTLAEVMVGVTILAMMLVALCGSLTFGTNTVRISRDDLRATQIMEQKMEAVRLLTWNQLLACPTNFTDWYYPPGSTNNTVGTIYTGKISVATPTNFAAGVAYKDQMRLVTVSLYWTNYNSGKTNAATHTRTMQTMYAYNGIQNYIWGFHP